MVETLIALVILAIGVLGAAGLQLASLRANKESSMQTGAVELAADIADALRVHGTSVLPHASQLEYDASQGFPQSPGESCYAKACTPGEIEAFLDYVWKQRFRSLMAAGRIRVCADARPWHEGQRAYAWECTPATDGSAPLVVKLGWPAHAADTIKTQAASTYPPRVVVTVAPAST